MTRRSNFRARRPNRPEASTAAAARVCSSRPDSSRTVTVTPSASKSASSTRRPSRTSAPQAAACRRSSSSNCARGTCHVCGARTSGELAKSANRSRAPSAVPNVAPHFTGYPWDRTRSWASDLVERVVHRGEQRLADVKAREAVALEQDDPTTGPGQPAGRRRPGGPAPDHHHVELVRRPGPAHVSGGCCASGSRSPGRRRRGRHRPCGGDRRASRAHG